MKYPLVEVPSDSYHCIVGGEEVYPQRGESVTFRTRVTAADVTDALRMEGWMYPDMCANVDLAVAYLKKRIASSTWRDDEGRHYSSVEAMVDDADTTALWYLLGVMEGLRQVCDIDWSKLRVTSVRTDPDEETRELFERLLQGVRIE